MKSKRGFAAMDPQKAKAIASMGGKAAHQKGSAYAFTSDEARIAGRKGGAAIVEKRGKEYMAEIGRKGGSSHRKRLEQREAREISA